MSIGEAFVYTGLVLLFFGAVPMGTAAGDASWRTRKRYTIAAITLLALSALSIIAGIWAWALGGGA